MDADSLTMFWLFQEHHILPGVYHSLPAGEKDLLFLMMQKIMEERRARRLD